MHRSIIAASALTILVLPLASPAAAAPKQRACPPPFMLLDFEQQVALVMKDLGLTRADAIEQIVQPGIDLIDKNGDRSLCFAFQNPTRGEPNVIDNAANPQN